jgi:hypothetical protein
MTLPWDDNGYRVLPAAAYMNHLEKMRTLSKHFAAAVDILARQFLTLIDQARMRLGGLFREADYPTPEELRAENQHSCGNFICDDTGRTVGVLPGIARGMQPTNIEFDVLAGGFYLSRINSNPFLRIGPGYVNQDPAGCERGERPSVVVAYLERS